MKLKSPLSIEFITMHSFKDEALLEQALTHSSCNSDSGDNQRLEFLGDAVLDLIVAEKLFQEFPNADEGDLDRSRANIVNGKSLARVANAHGLATYLRIGEVHRKHLAQPSNAMLEDALEALIGAVYIDGGILAAKQTVEHLFKKEFNCIKLGHSKYNPKGQLQEWSQKNYEGTVPIYRELPFVGPAHERYYNAAVFIGDEELGRGRGSSKKAAESEAAKEALKRLRAEK